MATDWEKDGLLTVVDKADRGGRVKTGTHFSSSDFFKTIGQTIDEILSLLVEAKPQIQLQLSLNCPACRTKPLLARQLWTDYSSRRWNDYEDLYRKNKLQSTANIADLPKRGAGRNDHTFRKTALTLLQSFPVSSSTTEYRMSLEGMRA